MVVDSERGTEAATVTLSVVQGGVVKGVDDWLKLDCIDDVELAESGDDPRGSEPEKGEGVV